MMITYLGRELLDSSIEIVKKMDYEVIYGDTDSLMINTKKKLLIEALKCGFEIKKEINS